MIALFKRAFPWITSVRASCILNIQFFIPLLCNILLLSGHLVCGDQLRVTKIDAYALMFFAYFQVKLAVDDIETILNTLIYDGKVEMILVPSKDGTDKLYRSVKMLVEAADVTRAPCTMCPVISFLVVLMCSRLLWYLSF